MIANLHYFPDSIRDYFGERPLLPLRGGAAGHRRRGARVRGVLRRRGVPGDLRGCAHRHRPDGARRAPPRGGRGRDAGGQAGRRHARVRRRAARPRGADHGLPGEARARGGAVGPRQLRHLHLRAARSSTTSPSARSWTGRRTCSRRCSANDVPFHIHEVRDYWNDVGSLAELRQGTFDALRGELRLQIDGEEVAPGVILAGGGGEAATADRRFSRTPRSRGRCGSDATCRSAPGCG